MTSAIDFLPTISSCQAVSQINRATARWGPHAGNDYSCRTGIACTVVCPGGEVDHVVKLRLYLGTVLFDGSQNAPAVFYEMNTREYPHASGFSISPGLTTLSCQVNGMTLDYSGPPK